jgi:hypothetical protein
MTRKARESFKSSELSRASAEVFAAAADHPITVTRRDGEPLVLMSEREDHARSELLMLASKLISISNIEDDNLVRFMSEQFPWMLALSPEDQKTCAQEVLKAAKASFSTGQAHLALSTLTSWQETATAIAAGLGEEPVQWIDDSPAVERP